jgi:hypothetical protein
MLVHNANELYITNNLFKKLQFLPEEIQRIILEYMLPRYKLYLNKNYYLQYHQLIFTQIPKNKIELYIRTMVRQDNSFIIHQLVSENWNKWLNTVNYWYRCRNYPNYIEFLNDFCFEQGATKSKEVIYNILIKNADIHIHD